MKTVEFKSYYAGGYISFLVDKIVTIATRSMHPEETSIYVANGVPDGDEFIVKESYKEVIKKIKGQR